MKEKPFNEWLLVRNTTNISRQKKIENKHTQNKHSPENVSPREMLMKCDEHSPENVSPREMLMKCDKNIKSKANLFIFLIRMINDPQARSRELIRPDRFQFGVVT